MVQGIAALNKKLTVTIPAKIEAATRAAMEKGAQELVDMMKRLVPVDHGDLRDSIGWTWGEAPKGSFTILKGSAGGAYAGLRIVVYAGNSKAFYARFQEFGTQAQPAQPYFFPSYRSLRRRIKSRITREMKKAIQADNPSET